MLYRPAAKLFYVGDGMKNTGTNDDTGRSVGRGKMMCTVAVDTGKLPYPF